MSDEARFADARVIWKEQPKEDTPVLVHHLNRRTQQLHISTRSEIVMSIVAALFLVAVLAWRLPLVGFALQPAALAASALWIAITAFRFRRIIWKSSTLSDVGSTGLEYYRRELEIRRDHLRNAWLWHGPLVLAALLFFANYTGGRFPRMDRFSNVAPLAVVLLLWVIVGLRRRFRQAADIEREIAEIADLEERQ